jgi:YD repeat-containing protein
MLPNGPYTLRLSATDAGLHTASTEVTVQITGNLKLGNFTLSFTDLSIPVSGIPITIMRSYDTLRANEPGDFGYGWRLEMWDADVRVDEATLGLSGFSVFRPFIRGTRVTVTATGGKPESFTFDPIPESRFFGLVTVWHPNFAPDPGVHSELTAPDVKLTQVGNEFISLSHGGISYNAADPAFGGTYDFLTPDGLSHHIDATTGDQLSVSDHNGNTLTFGSIESDTGRKVEFERDFRGRISAVIDPKGARIEYEYDARGDLVCVKDRMGNVTRFAYNPLPAGSYGRPADCPLPVVSNTAGPAHFVSSVADPLGVTSVTTAYETTSRIDALIDAQGKVINFDYDEPTRSETITDQVGTPATIALDPRGNLTRAVGGTGNASGCASDGVTCTAISKASYDGEDNVTSQTVVVGQEDSPANSETDDLKSEYTYNDLGVVVTQTDPLGNVTRTSYNAAGQPLAVSDALGNTTQYMYDGGDAPASGFQRPKPGNLIATADPLDNATFFEYDGRGNVTAITTGAEFNNWFYNDMFGGGVSANYDPGCDATEDPACYPTDPNRRPDLAKTTFTYNQYGDLASTTDPHAVTRNFSSDGNGNQTGSTFEWVNPNDPNDHRILTTTNVINGNDQVH